MHDQLDTRRKIRVLTIVDTFFRFSPAADPRFSYKGEDVALTYERICKSIGNPKAIRIDQRLKSSDVIDVLSYLYILLGIPGHARSDNGSEFVGKAAQK